MKYWSDSEHHTQLNLIYTNTITITSMTTITKITITDSTSLELSRHIPLWPEPEFEEKGATANSRSIFTFFRTKHLLEILAAPLVKPDYETQIKIFTQNIQNILKRESVANQIPCDQGDSRNMLWISEMSKGIGLLRRPGRK